MDETLQEAIDHLRWLVKYKWLSQSEMAALTRVLDALEGKTNGTVAR